MSRHALIAVHAAHALPALLLAALGTPSRCSAHELWLSPSSYRAAAGDTLSVAALVGTGFGGAVVPFITRRVLRLEWRGGRVVDLRPGGVDGNDELARWVVPDGAGGMVAYQSSFRTIELPAEEFDRYLRDEGLDGPLRVRAARGLLGAPGRERYARCAKAWIGGAHSRESRGPAAIPGPTPAARAGPEAAERATAPVGLPLEVVPARDPSIPHDSLEIRVLFRGRPLPGALVRAWRRPLGLPWAPTAIASRDSVGPSAEGRTDSSGRVKLPLAGVGEWLISCVHMVSSAEPAEADWESWWASLTFAR